MNLKFKVKAKSSWSQFHRDVVVMLTRHAIEELDIYWSDEMKIKVIMADNMDADEFGSMVCKTVGTDFIVWIQADAVKRGGVRKLADTLFHEFVHVKQSIYDGFFLTEEGAHWKDKFYDYDGENDAEYWNAAWEVEARAVAKKMVKRYFK